LITLVLIDAGPKHVFQNAAEGTFARNDSRLTQRVRLVNDAEYLLRDDRGVNHGRVASELQVKDGVSRVNPGAERRKSAAGRRDNLCLALRLAARPLWIDGLGMRSLSQYEYADRNANYPDHHKKCTASPYTRRLIQQTEKADHSVQLGWHEDWPLRVTEGYIGTSQEIRTESESK